VFARDLSVHPSRDLWNLLARDTGRLYGRFAHDGLRSLLILLRRSDGTGDANPRDRLQHSYSHGAIRDMPEFRGGDGSQVRPIRVLSG
jgi:hypothetical protein